MIIGLSGKKQSGKDLTCKIIQYLVSGTILAGKWSFDEWKEEFDHPYDEDKLDAEDVSKWNRKLFAGKVKDIACLLLNCTREQLEDNEFKERELGEEWWSFKSMERGKFLVPYFDATGSEPCIAQRLTPRLMLQLIGTECGREIIHPSIWVNALMSEYTPKVTYQGIVMDMYNENEPFTRVGEPTHAEYPNWIITDIRFPNEVKAIKDRDGVVIRINRNWAGIISKEDTHPSETSLDTYKDFDYVINNDGDMNTLIDKVRDMLKSLNII